MLHSFKYSILCALRNRSQLFWTLLFPIMLGTLFHFAFSSIIETTESFSEIPVAIVTLAENETSDAFIEMTRQLAEGDEALIVPQYTDEAQAEELLSNGDIDGIFYVNDEIRLVVATKGINSSILKTISDSYLQIFSTVSNIAQTRPDMINEVIEKISGDININQEIALSRGETDTFLNYFYSLIAMQCLFGSFMGLHRVINIQASLSPLAARRNVTPTRKMVMVLVDFAASVCIQFILLLVVLAYLVFVLQVNFGEQWGFVILTGFVGCILGVSFGTLVGSTLKANPRTTEGILVCFSLLLCFLSGLMMQNIKNIIENSVPIINRINPAALLTDAFYCLTVYDNYTRYTRNMISLLIISAIFCTISILMLRRKKYASL